MTGQPAGDREHRGDHRAAGAERLDGAVVPRRPDSERGLQRGDPAFSDAAEVAAGRDRLTGRRCRRRSARRRRSPPRTHATVSDSGGTINRRPISDMPIPVSADLVLELLRRQHRPHVFAEAFRRDLVDRQGSGLGVRRPAGTAETRRPRPARRRPRPADRVRAARDRSPRCWWSAAPAGLRRSPTCATRTAPASPGRLNRSLIVNPASVALPETARTPMSRERQ